MAKAPKFSGRREQRVSGCPGVIADPLIHKSLLSSGVCAVRMCSVGVFDCVISPYAEGFTFSEMSCNLFAIVNRNAICVYGLLI